MRKISNPLLAAFLLAEVIVAVSFVSQLGKYPQLWAVIGGFAVIAGVTAYLFVKNIADYYTEQKSVQDTQLAMLANSFVEQSDRICAKTDENVKALGMTVHTEMDGILTSIKTLLDKFGEQIDNTESLMEHVISDVKEALDKQIATAENRTLNMQNSIGETFDGGMKDMKLLLTSIQTVFDRKLVDIHAEYEKMLTDVKLELAKHTEDVRGSVSENTRILSENLDNYSQNVSVNLQDIWGDNVQAMETSCEEFLTRTSEILENRNLELMDKHTDYSHERIKEVSDEYDRIMNVHIANLKNEIREYISEFTTVNHAAFEQNAKNVQKLVGSEDKFIEELTSNNKQLNSVIAQGFKQYTDAVIEMFHELEGKLAQNIVDGTNVSKEHLSGISEHNRAVINELAENLRSYSDSFVDKSAEAIANVQRDNNLKLQEMCESYTDFSRDGRTFAESCRDTNRQTNASIESLIKQNKDFLENLQQVSSNSVEEIEKVLNRCVDNMSQKVETLNVDNSNRYHDAMENYRDSFVQLNADALANVQKENVNAVSNAYCKLAELADNVKKTDEQMNSLGKALFLTLDKTKQIIAEGNETASEKQEAFNEDLETNISNMKKIFTEKLSEYNEAFAELDNKISSVLNEVQKNTESYNGTLKYITDSQKAMNSLTSKDVQLLEKLVRG